MNKNTIVGKAKQIRGKLTETVGQLTGSPELKRDGLADQYVGNVQAAAGHVQDTVEQTKVQALAQTHAEKGRVAKVVTLAATKLDGQLHDLDGKLSQNPIKVKPKSDTTS